MFSFFIFCVDHLLLFLGALVSCYLFIIMLLVLAFNILMEYSSPNKLGAIPLISTAQYQQATPVKSYIFNISYGPIGPNGIPNQNLHVV